MRFDDTCPDDWAFRSIESRCSKITSGGTPSRATPSFYVGNGGIPWVKTKELNNWFIEDTEEHISDEAIRSSSAKMLPKSSVLIAMYGATVGELGILAAPMACNQACCALIVNQDTDDERFLFYQLLSRKQDIKNQAVGAAQQNISAQFVRSIELPTPPKAEQKAIAHILGTLDDKIELNRKTNETLEAMAKALFKSWFVDFDPVRAKAEGRPTGFPADISDLIPDSFEDSELGEIPSGWRDGEIQDVADLNPESWGSRNQPSKIRYLDLASVKYGRMDNLGEYEWEDAPSRARRILRKGDTVVGTVRPGNGSYCLIGEDGITGSTGFAVLRPKARDDDAFVYLGSCSKDNIDRLAHLADGGAYPAVRPELVAQTPVVIASRQVLDHFSTYVSPLFTNTGERERESKVLCHLRDVLLPKLISGKIRIPDAEKMLEEVGV